MSHHTKRQNLGNAHTHATRGGSVCSLHAAAAASAARNTSEPPTLFSPVFPAALLVLLAALAFLLPTPNAAAYGMPTNLPETPFLGYGDYRFAHWESWGQLKISPTVTLKIPVGFTPVPNYQRSRLLGSGWAFPLLESTCYAVSEREYEMRFPSGHRQRLSKTKTPNRLSGSNWIAQINGTTITAKSSCNWTLVFKNSQLQSLRTPDGGCAEFSRALDGTHRINVNGNLALSYKADFDSVTTQPIAHLTIKDNKPNAAQSGGSDNPAAASAAKPGSAQSDTRHALLRFGYRPAVVEIEETTKSGGSEKVTRETRIQTLTSVKWDGEKEQKYDFKINEMRTNDAFFVWSPDELILRQTKNVRYEQIKISGVNCLKTTEEDGRVSINGTSESGLVKISKYGNVPDIYRTEFFFVHSPLAQKTRKVEKMQPDGSFLTIEQYLYDENHNVRKEIANGLEIQYSDGGRKITARDVSRREIVWQKELDSDGKISMFKFGNSKFIFQKDSKNPSLVKVTQYTEEKVVDEALLPLDEVEKLFH